MQTMLCGATLVVAAVLLSSSTSYAQLSMRSMVFRSHIKYTFATTAVTSDVINNDSTNSHEALFEVILPEEAFISNFSMTVDGIVYPGEVKEKREAMAEYQAAKKRGQSAGYIKTTARHSNKFNVAVNLKPGSSVLFNLTYQQLLDRRQGVYEHTMNINPGRAVEELKVEVFLEESRNVTRLDTSLTGDLSKNEVDNTDIAVTEINPKTRYILYTPSSEQQAKMSEEGFSGEFKVKYDVERTSKAGEVLMVDGYFIHFFAPENLGDVKPVPKDIVFVLDISGSMSGTKIAQLQDAMSIILAELGQEDRFNVFSFNDRLFRWKDNLAPVTVETRREAISYVRGLSADGSTDINMALTRGVEFLLKNRDSSRASLVFFLTDGQPTSGVKDPASIADNVEKNNENVASVFGLAFGTGADYSLIKIVAVQNNGFARRIYEATDASEQVKGFYDEISSTMMQNLTIKYLNQPEAHRSEKPVVTNPGITTCFFKSVFEGNDVVVAGKMPEVDVIENLMSGVITASTSKGTVNIVLDNDTGDFITPDPQENPYFQVTVDFASVTEKSWAYLKINDLLKERKKKTYKKNDGDDTIDEQIKKLALKYNFVTPLTSMVATKPEEKASQTSVQGDEYEKQESGVSSRRFNSYQQPMGVQSSGYNIQSFPSAGVAYDASPSGGFPMNSNAHISRSMSKYPSWSNGGAAGGEAAGIGYRRYSPSRPAFRKQRKRRPGIDLATRLPPATYGYTTVSTILSGGPITQSTTTIIPDPKPRCTKKRCRKNRKKNKHGKKQKRKNKGPCKIVQIRLEGWGIKRDNRTECFKVKKQTIGSYQLHPFPSGIQSETSVQVTVDGFHGKPALVNIVISKKDNVTSLSFDSNDTASKNWSSSAMPSAGQVRVTKRVKCKRKGGIAYIFILIEEDDESEKKTRTKRDIRGKMARRSRRGKTSFSQCNKRIKKDKLTTDSNRLLQPDQVKGNGSPVIRL